MNNEVQQEISLDTTDCYANRPTIESIKNQEGSIIMIDNVNYGIQYGGRYNLLLPCNLPSSLNKTHTQVSFSGMVKETTLNEMMAGQPFVLTTCSILK
ncbi:MAG: hypothetical protein JWQ96_1260 [Segetibacter sp.]|nr:hypothetical protein [Segetibacter sp.]